MSLVACSFVFTTGLASAQSQEEMEHGNVWSRIIKHFDGKLTKSFKDPDKNRVIEEKYDENLVLMQKRLFQYDSKERLRNGVIMDAKGNALASTKYGYDDYDRINEERMYNAKGDLIQRKFPPGTLAGVLANAKYSVSFTIDPKNPTALGQMKATFDPIIQPTNNEAESFTPGIPLGAPQSAGGGLPAPTQASAPVGRKPFLPQKQR
jgi:hypothetical protein